MPQTLAVSSVSSPRVGWKLVECAWADCRSRGGDRYVTRVAPGYVVLPVRQPTSTTEVVCRSCHRKSYVTRRSS